MSQMVVYVRLSKKVASELEKKAPPEEWGPILEELLKNAKSLKPKKAPQGEKVELELSLPKNLSRKLSARARVWGVSWGDVIWTLLTAKTDEVKRAPTKKAPLKPKKKKTTKITSPAFTKKRSMPPEEGDVEVVLSPIKRVKLREDIELTLKQLEALKNDIYSIEEDIRFFTGDSERGKRVTDKYRKELMELEKKLKKALKTIEKEHVRESELDRIGLLMAEAEALRNRVFDEQETVVAFGPDYYEPEELYEPDEIDDDELEELLDKYLRDKGLQGKKAIVLKANEALITFLNIAKDLGLEDVAIVGNQLMMLTTKDSIAGTMLLPIQAHVSIELPDVRSFKGLKALEIQGEVARWIFEDKEIETWARKIEDFWYNLAKNFKEGFNETKSGVHIMVGGPKLDRLDRTPTLYWQLKNLKVPKDADVMFFDLMNGKIVLANHDKTLNLIKNGKDSDKALWSFVVGLNKREWENANFKKIPTLIELSPHGFVSITKNLPEKSRFNIWSDRTVVAYEINKMGGLQPIKLLQFSTLPSDDELWLKLKKFYQWYDRLPMTLRDFNLIKNKP